MITLENIRVHIGNKVLLEDASCQLVDGQKVGIIGKNGCGKSTLFKVLQHQIDIDTGRVLVPKNKKLAYAEQEIPDLDMNILDFVLARDKDLMYWRQKATESATEELADIMDHLTLLQSDSAEARVATILKGLGFTDTDFAQPVKHFSGGWRMRLALAGALFQNSDILLLDEPTNHLDLEATLWLEDYLKKYSGTLLIISHDQDLLNNLCTHILHFEGKRLVLYRGNLTIFQTTFQQKKENSQRQMERLAMKKEKLQSYVNRFRYKATKAKQAQSRLKMLERLNQAEVEIVPVEAEDEFHFPEVYVMPAPCIKLKNVSVGYVPGKPVLRRLNLQIGNNDRIALLGRNGNGKSTFAKLLSGMLSPESGEIVQSKKLRVGYFNQHQNEELPEKITPFDYIKPFLGDTMKEDKIRGYLAAFGLTQDQAISKIGTLSGGEKARLLLSRICLDKPQILILDEPTNHLDLQGRQALADALNEFNGTVILITHDFHILESVCDTLWLVQDGTCREFDGDLNDYKSMLLEHPEEDKSQPIITQPKVKKPSLHTTKQKIKELEKQLTVLEKQRDYLLDLLLKPDCDYASVQRDLKETEMQIAETENAWMELADLIH
ncbi:MAG: ABC-F family ATP-binding cassette domain-containing protein [Alphaproteobacteria bacterium]|nr:ABC-F family ATP-binding cassette domain-containing protein [Alphaproteobacteria bacterium]